MLKDKFTDIFVPVDDFCKESGDLIASLRLPGGDRKARNRKTGLCDSEVIAILLMFHHGHFTNFKHYYLHFVAANCGDLFPGLLSYNRFVELQRRVAVPLMLFLKTRCMGRSRGINFIDSTHIKACHIKREKRNRVFRGFAEKGHGTMGWFFGFKLHLIINDKGELLSYYLTKGNVDDRNTRAIAAMTKNIFGYLIGDKGYISKALSELLFNDGIQLLTKVRRNMKGQSMTANEKILLRKRALIECVNDELKNICKLEHTRHRSVDGFLLNLAASLGAYCFFPKKPSLNIEFVEDNQLSLAIA